MRETVKNAFEPEDSEEIEGHGFARHDQRDSQAMFQDRASSKGVPMESPKGPSGFALPMDSSVNFSPTSGDHQLSGKAKNTHDKTPVFG